MSSVFFKVSKLGIDLKSGLLPIARRRIKFIDGHLLNIYKSQLALRTRKLAIIMINVSKTQGLMKKMLHHEQQDEQNNWKQLILEKTLK